MKAKKEFDAVRMMREIRDRMSAEMKGTSFEEQKQRIEEQAEKMREKLRRAQMRGAA